MHVHIVPNRGSPPTVLLRESYREGNKVGKRTLANLSSLSAAQIEAIRAALRGEPLQPAAQRFEATASRSHGHVQAVGLTMRRLGLASLLASKPCGERDLVLAMMASRIVAPHTKLATTRWWHTTTLAEDFGVADASEDDLYAAMDWLLERQDTIQKKLAARHLRSGGLVLYDNMKTAVDKVKKGKGRVVNARFAVMCAHYLFDADFCNVASGWEKGVVEKNVQDSRRRIWLEAQNRRFGSFAELNVWLGERCRSLWNEVRHPEHKEFCVAEILEQECAEMMPMPTAFDGYVEKPARVSSTCLVSVQRNRYSVPCELAGQRVSTRVYPNRVGVVAGDALVASHDRLTERGQVCYDWQHYIPLVERKPGALRNGAPFADMPAPLKQLKLGLMRHTGGDRVMAQVLAAVPTAGLDAVLVAVELVIESGALSAEHVENVLARLNACPSPASVETSLQLKEAPQANTGRYDSLRGPEGTTVDEVEADHA